MMHELAGYRREVRHSLTGRTLEAADNLADVYTRWAARLEATKPRHVRLEARVQAYVGECQRIAQLMRDRDWDVYLMNHDDEAR